MNWKIVMLTAVALAVCASVSCVAQTPPVVTIDSEKRFCINGTPTFLIGTMGGDAAAWQNYLKPAGFNFRFLGSTATPGAHSVGLWELPDVFDDPAAVSWMRNDSRYLMWDIGYEIDWWLPYYLGWMDYTVDSIRLKRLQALANDPFPTRPIGACWGNAKRNQGSEHWGWQGYWTGYRQYFAHTDYMVIGDYDWGLSDETMSHAVRMSTKPVIYIVRCHPLTSPPEGTQPPPAVVNRNLWLAALTGVKGIIVDRYEMQAADGSWENWTTHTMSHWLVIEKAVGEIRQLENVLLTPGPWIYYKTEEPFGIMYTWRQVGSDIYLIAVNADRQWPKSFNIPMPTLESSATGEVLFDYLVYGPVTAVPSATALTDSTKNWTANQYAGKRLRVRHGTPAHDHYYQIVSNTSNTLNISGGNLIADGVAWGQAYEILNPISASNWQLPISLGVGERKVVRFSGLTFVYPVSKTPAAVGTPSNRKWKLLMDYSSQVGTECVPEDAFGLCYDSYRHRLVAIKGLGNFWPQGKPDPTWADVAGTNYVWEWDLDSGWYSGPIQDGEQQGGDPWPTDANSYHDASYDPVRHCIISFNKDTREVEEWYGPELGWRRVTPKSGDGQPTPGNISHYAAVYVPTRSRWLFTGGKKWDFVNTYNREGQFDFEWFNLTHTHNGTNWYLHGNPLANLPLTALQEPEMVWDSARNQAVLFGLSHDGRYNTQTAPTSYFQDTPQQTYTITEDFWCSRRYTPHVPYVYYNYQMVFDPRSASTLLFGGWPSVNGRGTDLYEYTNNDWRRLDYDYTAVPAQDARRIPSVTYDPDHQMVLFLDTRGRKIWGLTSGQETQMATIDAVRNAPNGTLIAIDGKIVSRRLNGCFYMQEANGTSGIRVVSNSTAAAPGKLVNVIGTVGTLPTGEKQITAQVVGVVGQGTVRPRAMGTRYLGGVAAAGRPGVFEGLGPNNIGSLVRVFGKVTATGAGYVYIDDGSGLSDGSGNVGVKVVLNGAPAPGVNQHVAVTGISGIENIAGHNARVVLVADASDVTVF